METSNKGLLRLFIYFAAFISITLLAGCETLDTKQGKLFSFTSHTAKAPAPTVIVAHGCDGRSIWSEDWKERLLGWGYNAVVVDQFSKRGYSGPNGVCGRPWLVPADERNEDISELVDWIKQQKWHQGDVGLIGMSHGGAVAIDAANNELTYDRLKATVALYPGCLGVRVNFMDPKIPVQVHLGKLDTWSGAPCLSANWKNYEMYVYEKAGHAFDINRPWRIFAGYELWYDAEATDLSQKRIREFFGRNLR